MIRLPKVGDILLHKSERDLVFRVTVKAGPIAGMWGRCELLESRYDVFGMNVAPTPAQYFKIERGSLIDGDRIVVQSNLRKDNWFYIDLVLDEEEYALVKAVP